MSLVKSAKEIMFSSALDCLFVCLLAGLRKKTTQLLFTKFGGMVAHGPMKKSLDFGGNPHHVTLGLGLR